VKSTWLAPRLSVYCRRFSLVSALSDFITKLISLSNSAIHIFWNGGDSNARFLPSHYACSTWQNVILDFNCTKMCVVVLFLQGRVRRENWASFQVLLQFYHTVCTCFLRGKLLLLMLLARARYILGMRSQDLWPHWPCSVFKCRSI
jgi:hypothetical protein